VPVCVGNWHKTDLPTAPANVRCRGVKRTSRGHVQCPLMTWSGHWVRQSQRLMHRRQHSRELGDDNSDIGLIRPRADEVIAGQISAVACRIRV
jgi:hypothetical protein